MGDRATGFFMRNTMGYNVAVCLPPILADDAAAWNAINELIDSVGDVPDVFKNLYRQITAAYPCICELPDDLVDNAVWSDGPLWSNFGHRAAVLGIEESRADEVVPFLVINATSLGLTVFDWATQTIYRP
jgi:hypothetical protein